MHGGAGRPTIMATRGLVSSGHYLASASALRILQQGGNAIDAGVAAGLVLNVVHNEMCSLGGVAPIIVYDATAGRVETISGLGRWPRAASIEYFHRFHNGTLPEGILRCVHPAAVDAWFVALERYGTMSFEAVAQDAIALAEGGFPVHELITWRVQRHLAQYKRYPLNRTWFVPDGEHPIQPGQLLVQPDLAHGLRRLAAEEQRHRSQGRKAALQAARDLVFKGQIARELVDYAKTYGGLFTLEDMADFTVRVEPPIRTTYKDYEIYGCGPWCQGPVFLMALNILENFDLQSFGLEDPQYYHVVIEALKLAFSDREAYVGDPDFVDVPMGGLLSKEYARTRSALISRDRAFPGMPPAGDPWAFSDEIFGSGSEGDSRLRPQARGRPGHGTGPRSALSRGDSEDTTYVAVMDAAGNIFSATPSDGYVDVPIVPGVGFSFSKRGSQSWMEPDHPSSIGPWKRPRLTPNPAIVFRQGKPWMAIGSPGLDMQPQAMLQAFLAHVEFGHPIQAAIEAPRVGTYCFPSTSYPHEMEGVLKLEGRIPSRVASTLADLGHEIEAWPAMTHTAGGVSAILRDSATGCLHGGADPRRMNYAIGF